jgi:hypothetical protein
VPGGWKSVAGQVVRIEYLDQAMVHIVLEQTPGDQSSRASLLADTRRLRGAIGKAFYAEGASILEVGGYLTVTWTGYDGSAKDYSAEYTRPPRVHIVSLPDLWGEDEDDQDEG